MLSGSVIAMQCGPGNMVSSSVSSLAAALAVRETVDGYRDNSPGMSPPSSDLRLVNGQAYQAKPRAGPKSRILRFTPWYTPCLELVSCFCPFVSSGSVKGLAFLRYHTNFVKNEVLEDSCRMGGDNPRQRLGSTLSFITDSSSAIP